MVVVRRRQAGGEGGEGAIVMLEDELGCRSVGLQEHLFCVCVGWGITTAVEPLVLRLCAWLGTWVGGRWDWRKTEGHHRVARRGRGMRAALRLYMTST